MRSGRWATKGRHAGNGRHPGDTVKLIAAELEHTCPTSQPQQTRSQPQGEVGTHDHQQNLHPIPVLGRRWGART
ncbi:hypothetical protein [Mycobacterium marinum]|uniref:hypothetical protein n=1 Tax=Mycobacterium marinum TaxID=1781 RepID=UPI003FF088DE